MPIMAAYGQSDARLAAHLLANTAVDCLRNPQGASEWQIALNNVYRLLESFRRNPFFADEAPTRGVVYDSADALTLTHPTERHVADVSQAIADALNKTFAQQSQDEAIVDIERVLQGIAYPNKFPTPTEQQVQSARKFFEALLQNLKLA